MGASYFGVVLPVFVMDRQNLNIKECILWQTRAGSSAGMNA
jgi:hypothetical protein